MSDINKMSRQQLSKAIRALRDGKRQLDADLVPLEEAYTRKCAEESALKKMGKLRLSPQEQEALQRLKERESAAE